MELTKEIIEQITMDNSDGKKISIYIPTHPKSTSQSINEDSTRFKNAIQKIENKYAGQKEQISESLKILKKYLDDMPFWKHQTSGLAAFVSGEEIKFINLPYAPSEISIASDTFMVSPLYLMENIGTRYYILDVNLKKPALYLGSVYDLKIVEDADLPNSIDDELDIEQRKKSMQFRPNDSRGNAMFFGHASVDERHDDETEQYSQILADRLNSFLTANDSNLQLILCGTEERLAQLRPKIKYANLSNKELYINPEDISLPELHRAIYELVASQGVNKRKEKIKHYNSIDVELKIDGYTAVEAAIERGAIETLFVPAIRKLSEPSLGSLSSIVVDIPEDVEALDSVIKGVLDQGGDLAVVDEGSLGEENTIKAILRF